MQNPSTIENKIPKKDKCKISHIASIKVEIAFLIHSISKPKNKEVNKILKKQQNKIYFNQRLYKKDN